MNCLDCKHFLQSRDAGQRAYIDDYGYCKAGKTPEERAMFFPGAQPCWIRPERFERKRVAA